MTRAVSQFACSIANRVSIESLLELMADRELARESDLPATGVPLDWERVLSAIQIRAKGYGTRATTTLSVRTDGLVSSMSARSKPRIPTTGPIATSNS